MNQFVLDNILEAIRSDEKFNNFLITFSSNEVIYISYKTFVVVVTLTSEGTEIDKINARKFLEKSVTDKIFNRDFYHDPHRISHCNHHEPHRRHHDYHYHKACEFYLKKPNPPYSLIRTSIDDYLEYIEQDVSDANILKQFMDKLKEISKGGN